MLRSPRVFELPASLALIGAEHAAWPGDRRVVYEPEPVDLVKNDHLTEVAN